MKGNSAKTEALVSMLYDGTMDADSWRSALLGIAQSVGGTGTCLLTYSLDTGALLRDEVVGLDASSFGKYRSDWAVKDIRIVAGANTQLLEPVTEECILPGRQWERSEIFSDFLRHEDIGFMIGAWLKRDPRQVSSISIQAAGDAGPFSQEAVDFVRPLMPHVRRALLIREQLERRQLQSDALRSAFEQVAFGAMILDDAGEIVDASAAAVATLTEARAIERRSRGSYRFVGQLARQIQRAVGSGLRTQAPPDGTFRVPRANRQPVSLTLAPLPDTGTVWLSNVPRWVVLVTDPDAKLQVSVTKIMQQLQVSEREAEITAALCAGCRVLDVAARFGISQHTVRSHLKSIFSKTGLHTQTDLVRHVTSAPVWN